MHMAFGKRVLLTAFLERDNLKLLAFEASGKTLNRTFGGQITFGADVLREAFIVDPIKFSSQVKMALSQKEDVAKAADVVLFVPAEKTFVKAMPTTDGVEVFIRSLPYFKEELLIDSEGQGEKVKGEADNALVNHIAFEKKLIEDFERPFLETGKKVSAAVATIKVLAQHYSQSGKYLLLMCFEKDCVAVVMQDGVILDQASFPKDVFVSRLNEFRLGKGFADVRDAYVIGTFEAGVVDKIRTEQQLNVKELAGGDIYDLVAGAYFNDAAGQGAQFKLPSFSLPQGLEGKMPNPKYLFLAGAAVIGFILVVVLAKNLGKVNLPKMPGSQTPVVKKTIPVVKAPPPAPAPTPKPADFKVRVLNGTTVTGEAGRAGDSLKALGFDVVETKNATASGFVATRLRVAADVPQEISDQIKTTLLNTYASVNVETLVDDAVKIEVIVGKKKT